MFVCVRVRALVHCGTQSHIWCIRSTNLDDPEGALKAANAVLDRALDRAEVILMWVLGSEANDMTLEKAQRALNTIEDLVRTRREAATVAADPVQAAALVEKAEKKRQLIGNVISAMKLREEAELACGSQPVQSASVVWRPAHTASATTNLSDPEAAFNAATAALDKALDRAEVILTWVLGSEAKGMTLEKAQRALTSVENLVRERREGARLAADPVQAAALVEKAEKKQQLISSVIDAMRLKEDAELALRQQGTSNGAKR